MKQFIYKGTGDTLFALGHELKKGQPFTTEDPAVIELLSHSANVQEYQPEESKKPSRKTDADKS